jgi:hypothetical protein
MGQAQLLERFVGLNRTHQRGGHSASDSSGYLTRNLQSPEMKQPVVQAPANVEDSETALFSEQPSIPAQGPLPAYSNPPSFPEPKRTKKRPRQTLSSAFDPEVFISRKIASSLEIKDLVSWLADFSIEGQTPVYLHFLIYFIATYCVLCKKSRSRIEAMKFKLYREHFFYFGLKRQALVVSSSSYNSGDEQISGVSQDWRKGGSCHGSQALLLVRHQAQRER